MKRFCRGGLIFACLTLLMPTFSARAAEEDNEQKKTHTAEAIWPEKKDKAHLLRAVDPVTLDSIVVSATLTEHTAFEAPASVTNIGPDLIAKSQGTTLRDLLENIPNLAFSDPANPLIQKPSLRGLAPNQTIFKIDGARQNYTSQSGIGHAPAVMDPEMLKEVEVLRGPSSVLHGSGGIGGVISLRTKVAADLLKPGENFGFRLKSGYMSATHQPMSSLAVYGRQGIFDFLAQGVYRNFGDTHTTHPSHSKDINRRHGHAKTGMVKVSAAPKEGQNLSIVYNYSDRRFESKNTKDAFTEQEQRIVGNYRLKSPTSAWLDMQLTTQATWRDNGYKNDLRNLKDAYRSYGGHLDNTSRFSMGGFAENALTYGLDYYHDHQEGTDFGQADPSRPDSTAHDLGVFLQDEITLFERVTLIPAARWTSYRRSSDSGIAKNQSETKFTPKFTAQVRVAPWLNLFGGYTESYRPPSLDEIYYAMDMEMPWGTIRVLPNPKLKPESAKTWEAGYGLVFDSVFTNDDPLRFKAVFFRENIKNLIDAQQVKDFSEPPLGEIHYKSVNVSRVERHGYELELEYRFQHFNFSASYGKTIGRDKDTRKKAGGSPGTLSLRADYLFAKQGVDVFWRSKFVETYKTYSVFDEKEISHDSYTVHGIGLVWKPAAGLLKDFRLDFGIDNIFDERYKNHNDAYEIARNVKCSVSFNF